MPSLYNTCSAFCLLGVGQPQAAEEILPVAGDDCGLSPPHAVITRRQTERLTAGGSWMICYAAFWSSSAIGPHPPASVELLSPFGFEWAVPFVPRVPVSSHGQSAYQGTHRAAKDPESDSLGGSICSGILYPVRQIT